MPDRCHHCGYDLSNLGVPDGYTTICPECGTEWRPGLDWPLRRASLNDDIAAAAYIAVIAPLAPVLLARALYLSPLAGPLLALAFVGPPLLAGAYGARSVLRRRRLGLRSAAGPGVTALICGAIAVPVSVAAAGCLLVFVAALTR